ncbi:ThuA domain-containing protein [Salinigranum sp. GCM10025319]|uniref:ThuA domain-containing protein n=1 Tax=Salinigranum sp. GCM10025319 TaxID=3252687 RepID=UPI0036099874
MTDEPDPDTTGDPPDEHRAFRLDRRTLMQASATTAGVFGLSSVASADGHLDEEPIELEATMGSVLGQYAGEGGMIGPPGLTDAIDDWRAGDLDIQTLIDVINAWRNGREVDTTLGPDERGWIGRAPASLAGTANPALSLTAGTEYTIELSSDLDESITFVIADAEGDAIETFDPLSGAGDTQTVTFTASESMAMYYAEEYPEEMRGQIQVGGTPGELTVSDLEPTTATITSGYPLTVSATVTNTGSISLTQTVVLSVGDTEVATQEVTVEGGSSTTVSFEGVDTSGLAPGEYTHAIATDDDSASGSLTVEAAADEVNLLIFSATAGFRHSNIEYGIEQMQGLSDRIAQETGADSVTIDAIPEDASQFPSDVSGLEPYDAVIWFSTTGDVINNDQQAAFEQYIQNGGGYVGIHAAADTEYNWEWYGDMLGGGYFNGHPPGTYDAEINVTDRTHPSTDHLPARWNVHDEWYGFQGNPRGDVHVLAELDETSYIGEHNQNNPDNQIQSYMNHEGFGRDHPIAWCQHYQGGRAWYTARGHTAASFDEEDFITHILGGIYWAAGFRDDPSNGTIWDSYDREVLVDGLNEPMKMEMLPSGDLLFTERTNGQLSHLDTTTGEVTAVLELDVYSGQEDGMQGIAIDPDFEENGWLYLYYAPTGETVNRLSRFTWSDGSVDPSSEVTILDVPVQRETCCHTGGDIEFDTEGNIVIATGDDTNPFESSGYTPIDERDGREPFDAQRTSANTNDLRGSVLRITPQDDGSYTIPEGNLFTAENGYGDVDQSLVQQEIFGMGFRNPFTATVDPETNELWIADYGPDAGGWNPDRGPNGITEFVKVDDPGFYGWPYFTGSNIPYRDYDFETGASGDLFDPENPINESVNNTGLTELPSAQGSSIMNPSRAGWDGFLDNPPAWDPYMPYDIIDQVPYPNLTTGAPMVGTVYRSSPEHGDGSLTDAFDGKVFIMDYGGGWIKYISTDDEGEVMQVDPFLPDENWGVPFDMSVGPSGELYFMDYNGSISRVTGGGQSTTASVSVSLDQSELGPGESTTATVEIENISGSELTDLDFSLSANSDVLSVTPPSSTTVDSLGSGEAASVDFDVAVSGDATQGSYGLSAVVAFTLEGEERTASSSVAVTVPKTQETAPYGANFGGLTGTAGEGGDPVVINGLEFVNAPNGPADLEPVEVSAEDHPDFDFPNTPSNVGVGSPTTDDISGTDADPLYQSEFYGYNLSVEVPIPNGTYDVTLHNAEIYHESDGNRVFDVAVQGETVVEGLDIHAEVGHDAAWTMTVEAVEVTDGSLSITTNTQTDFSKFAGIEIRFSEPLQNGLEAYYSLDEETPTNAVTGNDATIEGDVTTGAEGIVGDAYEFSTNGDIGSVADAVVSEPLPINGETATVGAWINHGAITEDFSRVYHVDENGSLDSPSNGWNVEFGGTDNSVAQQYWSSGNIGANSQPSVPVPENEWIFVVTVIDGDDCTIYAFDEDGQLDGSPGTGTGTRGRSEMASLIMMAGDGRDTPGRMDDVWAYSRALSESEVQRLYSQSLSGTGGGGGGDGPGEYTVPFTDGGTASEPAFTLLPEGDTFVDWDNDGEPSGADDLSADAYLGWDADNLYLRVEVTDDVHTAMSGENMWQADNLQWAVGSGTTYGPEYGMSLVDGSTEMYRWIEGNAQTGISSITASASRSGTTTTYEATIPWEAHFQESKSLGDSFPFSVLINERDEGDTRDAILGWTLPGISSEKTVDALGTLTLGEETDSGTEGLDPSTTIELEAQSNQAWTGVAPDSITGENPTLQLREGETYTVEWTNGNGVPHNFVVEDADGNLVVETSVMGTQGETQTVEFTAESDLVTYYCSPHRGLGMEGDIEIV